MTKSLISKKFAYENQGHVYFSVSTHLKIMENYQIKI